MQQIVANPRQTLPRVLYGLLPQALVEEVERVAAEGAVPEEIRLRRDRYATVTLAGENRRIGTVLTGKEMDALLVAFCEGSLYAHSETLCEGYLMLPQGVRVGVCGRATMAGGKLTGVSEIAGFAIRLPHAVPPVGEEICNLLRELSFSSGVLLYAPPGVGKTTLLRAVTARLAGGAHPLRVAVVDTRGELGYSLSSPSLTVDVLSGYPRGHGITLATRTLSPQLIVCDEIGDLKEAQEIAAAHSSGVPLLATAHAANVEELLARPGMRLLHEAHCFGAYAGLSRRAESFDYCYDILPWRAADAKL